MALQDRIRYFTTLFDLLQSTNSRTEKELIVKQIPKDMKEDFNYILECLAGKHKFGFKYYKTEPLMYMTAFDFTVKQLLEFLQIPMSIKDLREWNIDYYVQRTNIWYDFLEPIVNRTLRLGIGNSLLEKSNLSPMLAKKFEGDVKYDKKGYYITEKLDGNRCIAYYDNDKWNFISRNGKPMFVDFDMSTFDTNLIYDGEILSKDQVDMSVTIARKVKYGISSNKVYDDLFSSTSGTINKHSKDKDLVYNVFDIICNDATYAERREVLNNIEETSNVRILPLLDFCPEQRHLGCAWDILDKVTSIGGEGIMINLGSAFYQQKRTDQLLKLKKVYTMDMKVYDIEYGTGKYEGQIGSLKVEATTEDGKEVYCSVGTGLSDEQRLSWALHPNEIVGKIIEVSYFSLSQTKDDKEVGNNIYSLRFPRLKKVRTDKVLTSEF